MSVATLAAENYQSMAQLSLLLEREFGRAWRSVLDLPATLTVAALMEILPGLVDEFGDMSGALAADFYESVREEAGARGRFAAKPAALPTVDEVRTMVNWGTQPLLVPEPATVLAEKRVGSGLQRIVLNVSRETVVKNTAADPAATGWRRIARSNGCDFCKMLSDKGHIFKDVGARFASHTHCGCTAAPAFSPGTEVSVLEYQASQRTRSQAEKDRLRAYLNKHYPSEPAAT